MNPTFHRVIGEAAEIRQFEPRHAEMVFGVVERNRQYLREWLPWVDQTKSSHEIREFILRAQSQYHSNQGPNAGIWVEGEFAGSIGCHKIDWINRSCSIGYWIDARYQGRGIVTTCCESLLDYLFHEMGLHRVVIQCGTGNAKSGAIPKRLGFTREGVSRDAEWVNDRWIDLVVWSMLENEWRPAAENPPTE
ncbi:MAG TPA: GNAT family protein [Candidatus Sulfopaludibacter sp.]|jgi:ribosomal-protein-serine acetyltransferase|nr:GNAT family protein [Candidatus Sulfopaludibacter sp.]